MRSVSSSRRAFALNVVRCAVVGFALACLPRHASAQAAGELQAAASRLATAFEQSSKAVVGVSVYDLRTGEALVDLRSGESFAPASNQKLLTSAFALARLGKDFAFTTRVYRVGEDVAVVGDGDPALGDPILAAESGKSIYDELDRWAAAVKASFADAPVRNLLLCMRRSEPTGRHPDWPGDQHDRWYAAPISELSFHNNCFDVMFTVAGGQATPAVTPASRLIQIVNNVNTGGKATWSLRANDDESQLTLVGSASKSSTEPQSVAANNPPLMLARTLVDRLALAGVTVTGEIRMVPYSGQDLAAATELCTTATPLATAFARANKRSLNMAAECIMLRAGDGTWPGSAAAMTAALSEHYGISPGEVIIRDGSGLSHSNRVTPSAMARVLATVACRQDAMTLILSLPRGGVDGTLSGRFKEKPCLGRVLGKTGYIMGSSCLSGYVLDSENRATLAFSILANRVPGGSGWQAKRMQDQICEALVRHLDAEAPAPQATTTAAE